MEVSPLLWLIGSGRRVRLALTLVVLLSTSACAVRSDPFPLSPVADAYGILETSTGRFVTLAEMADRVADADVIFFGEFHEDAVAHGIQRELMEIFAARNADLILGMEMFERDVAEVLERWQRDEISDEEFLRTSRPWPNYSTAYGPLVDIARREGWPVVGTNLPQVLASTVARGGLAAMDSLRADDRRFAPEAYECSEGEYWDRFVNAIVETADSSGHMALSESDPMLRNMFEAQCARDEAMAESLSMLTDDSVLVFHVNGAFHSDFRLGTVSRLLRRQPQLMIRTISAFPLEGEVRPDLEEHRSRADFVIFTP